MSEIEKTIQFTTADKSQFRTIQEAFELGSPILLWAFDVDVLEEKIGVKLKVLGSDCKIVKTPAPVSAGA